MFLSLNMLMVCVRNDLGREFAQSDSLLTHTFSTVVFYNEVMLICYFDFDLSIFIWTVYKMYVLICDTFCLTCPVVSPYMNFVDLLLLVVVKALLSLCLCHVSHIRR